MAVLFTVTNMNRQHNVLSNTTLRELVEAARNLYQLILADR